MSQHFFRVLAYAGALAAASCTTAPVRSAPAVGVVSTTVAPGPAPSASVTAASPLPSLAPGATVTVAQVVALALANGPQVASAAAARAVAAAEVDGTRAWANPEVDLRAGRARYRDGSGRVSVGGIELRQPVTLPGKRGARIDAALAEQQVVARQLELERVEVEVQVRAAALRLAVADATATQAQQTLGLAQQLTAAVARRVQAQEATPADLGRARLDELTAQLAADAALRTIDAARRELRSWCGDALPTTFTLMDVWPELPAVLTPPAALAPLAAGAQAEIAGGPRAALRAAERAAGNAALERERRAWQPELSAGVTADRASDTNDVGVVVGIELPLWNRNAAGIAGAEAARAGIMARAQTQRLAEARAAASAWQAYESARLTAVALATQALPAASTALEVRLRAYAVGEASVIEVIDARRTATAIAVELLSARADAARAELDLRSVLGVAPAPGAASTTIPTPSGVQP